VLNLQTGAALAGATVSVAGLSPTADAAGACRLPNIPPGTYQATASVAGFISQTVTVAITSGATTQASFALVQSFPDITITLVWGAQPQDLDLHLSGPAPGGGRFHAFFLDPTPVPYAALTLQDDNQLGPEQMVIRRDPATGQFVAGDYHLWVHNFSGTPEFNVSQARVIINNNAQLLGVFDVNNANGDPALELWYVVNLEVDAVGNVTLVPVQQFTNGSGQGSFTILAPPYGSKPVRP